MFQYVLMNKRTSMLVRYTLPGSDGEWNDADGAGELRARSKAVHLLANASSRVCQGWCSAGDRQGEVDLVHEGRSGRHKNSTTKEKDFATMLHEPGVCSFCVVFLMLCFIFIS